ncbi:oxygen-independent coproporphyrinogen III oxidase [Rhodomicrobium vannielii ATCC 17100]|uniref:oxygen-independent coproporphyrinogen III oxidase n=1 Tax=Rhodomicrobium vannielii TaxID=1069 RepID=UPI001917B008|nr:oxygen-independent coproporphyrinogen III oxidase [Rhodomicrobium vannielii]MBJ7533713.1 oxygen-independent coproporphyrinogen III oxidase [Rhodomicrobium vannielii ATCC 17100]
MIPGIAKYFHARVPRYTSYPTAPHFTGEVDAKRYGAWLSRLDPETELSLYLHIPFCRRMCWYCGCNMRVIARYSPVTEYVETLIKEIDLACEKLPKGSMKVRHIHWGGGTPTALNGEDMVRIHEAVASRFDILPNAEIAVEIDPRTFTQDNADALGKIGCTRASLGIQEFDITVQEAINRVQPMEVIEDTIRMLHEQNVKGLNFDLMYGLPHQTAEMLTRTVEQAATLKPDRIALFGYAHVPWMAKNQRMIPEDALPTALMRFEQATAAGDALEAAGYVRIGLDHFARPEDSMAIALREGHLHRNFQGYTDDLAGAIVAFGASAISETPEGFMQNIVETGAYSRAVNSGELPVAKGVTFRGEDKLRSAIIERLMCDMEVDLDEMRRLHAPNRDDFYDELAQLRALQDEGLCELDGSKVRVPDAARPALRVVCSVFDDYLQHNQGQRHAAAV